MQLTEQDSPTLPTKSSGRLSSPPRAREASFLVMTCLQQDTFSTLQLKSRAIREVEGTGPAETDEMATAVEKAKIVIMVLENIL